MRLLNTSTLRLHEFQSAIPPYAILSHTWGDGEVTFDEIGLPGAEYKAGFWKIKQCCAQAESDGLEFAWVDTCCIDKTSSAELSEAINSMFQWYQQAHVCYAYLADVDNDDVPGEPSSTFRSSSWFKRGWTLQELIAPSDVVFYASDWSEIGTKASLLIPVSTITKIGKDVLMESRNMFRANIAQRMSWASERKTTRVEDIAYSLMGLFDINMPLLYGEGAKAFRRLQLELLGRSNDHSIFAWRADPVVPPVKYPSGVLADSPAMFKHSGEITTTSDDATYRSTISMTNIGLSIRLSVYECRHFVSNNEVVAVLNCKDKEQRKIGIYLGGRLFSTAYYRSNVFSFAYDHLEEKRSAEAQMGTMENIYLDTNIWKSFRSHNPLVEFMIVASPANSRPAILKEALKFDRERVIDDSFELIEPHGCVFLSLQGFSESFGLRFETMTGESFGLALCRYNDEGRMWTAVLLNLNEQSLHKLALSALSTLRRFKNSSGRDETGWDLFRDRISFTLPSTESINVSIKRLPTFKKEQEAYYKLEIFEMSTKSSPRLDS